LAKAISLFIPIWTQNPSPIQEPNLPRLMEAFKTRTILAEKPTDFSVPTNAETNAAIKLDAVVELPLTRPRASMFHFVSSLVSLFFISAII
jgi:hypothetical protein